jgi:Flp pilus assembly protein TadG
MKIFRIRDDRGQSAVEFAVILPLVVAVILALADFGRALFMYEQAEHAASDGARLAAVNYQPASGSLATYIQQNLLYGELKNGATGAGAQGPAKVCISFPATSPPNDNTRGAPVRVIVSSGFNFIPGGVIPGTIKIAGSATMRLEQDSSIGTAGQTTGGSC